ncbi:MAG: hypothetical protein ACYC92_00765 [Candidatus Acidiferrales bacterium]
MPTIALEMLRPLHLRALNYRPARLLAAFLPFLAATLLLAGCHRVMPTNTVPLDSTGMNFSAIQTLKSLDVTNAEVAQLVTAKQGGLSDNGCVALVRLARSRKEQFHTGEDVAQLFQAGVSEPTIIELAQLNQIGLWTGEAQAMRLAGISDRIILEEARRRAAGQPVLSGASLANFKNAGMSESALLALVRRGVPDSDARKIIALRRRGWSDTRILRLYSSGR